MDDQPIPAGMVPLAATPPSRGVQYAHGLLVGAAAGALSGAAWWAITTLTEFEQWPWLALGVGLATGVGVLGGARRGGLVPGVTALVLTALAIAISVYFIDRSLTISAIEETGRVVDVPLWQGFGFVRERYQRVWDVARGDAYIWALASLLAVAVAGWPSRRAPGD